MKLQDGLFLDITGDQQSIVADLQGKILDAPLGPIFVIFMQFSVKFGQIIIS